MYGRRAAERSCRRSSATQVGPFAKFAGGRHSACLLFSTWSLHTCQAFPRRPQGAASDYRKTRTVNFTRTPHWVERLPFAALPHRRGSVDVSCRDFPCVAVANGSMIRQRANARCN